MMNEDVVTPIKVRALSPHHYQSLPINGGTASLSRFLADRAVIYGLSNAFGFLSMSCALPEKDYKRDLMKAPWVASVLETKMPRLLPPQGRRLNLDDEGGYQKNVQDATGSGNLKTWYQIQEVPSAVEFSGALYGKDPFALASEIERVEIDEIVFRVGRGRGGIICMSRGDENQKVRVNLHTGVLFKNEEHLGEVGLEMDVFALYDIQVSQEISLSRFGEIASLWR